MSERKAFGTAGVCLALTVSIATTLVAPALFAQEKRDRSSAAPPISRDVAALIEVIANNASDLGVNLPAGEFGKSLPYPVGGTGAPAQLLRIAPADYDDGVSTLAGQSRLSAREVSNIVVDQPGPVFSQNNASDMVWQWGQFVDHDVDLTEGHDPVEPAPIAVPLGDPYFDPFFTGVEIIPLNRSIYDPTTGTDPGNPRQQVNEISGPIDATNVYGQDPDRTLALRTLDGTGRLKTSAGNLLPFNVDGLPNAMPGGVDPADFFLAGDIRSNEQLGLTSMHTLWVREHNLIADATGFLFPWLTGDQIFEIARRTVITEIQVITFREFLPVLLGPGSIGPYAGYDPSVNPGISTEFSTALYRLGHTMLSPAIQRLNADGTPIPEGPLSLRDAFFAPATLVDEGGIDPILKGLSSQVMQRIDNLVVDDLRNFLFGPPGAGGLDLASLNIQRGRDHGLPDYNTVRIHYGLAPVASFADISSDPEVQSRLATAYTSVDDIDLWIGAISEDPVSSDSLVGELLFVGLKEQFERLRDGDPSWYQNALPYLAQRVAETQTLKKVIARNTRLRRADLQDNVFIVP